MGRMKEVVYIWQIAEQKGIIALQCHDCSHRGFVPASALKPEQQQIALFQMKVKCTQCRSTSVKALPYQPM